MITLDYIKLMRPHQWLKNLFCFAGILFSGQFITVNAIYSFMGFVTFCLMSSSVYVMNDIIDINTDILHPKKKFRPIASRKISIKYATFISILLAIASVAVAYQISRLGLLLIVIYFITNVLYSIKLKNVVIVDVFIISFGFILRLLMGTWAINIEPSKWIIFCSIMITLFFGFAKRKSEILTSQNNVISRQVLHYYSHDILDIFLAIMASCSIMCYCLFVILGSKLEYIWVTVPFVIFAIVRYIYILITKNYGQDTSKDIFHDLPIMISCILFLLTYIVVILYSR
jgi:4-hydroxybenzoate polyprenyltransferase